MEEITFPQLVKSYRDNLLAHIELKELRSKVQRKHFLALVKEGFTEDQALKICSEAV